MAIYLHDKTANWWKCVTINHFFRKMFLQNDTNFIIQQNAENRTDKSQNYPTCIDKYLVAIRQNHWTRGTFEVNVYIDSRHHSIRLKTSEIVNASGNRGFHIEIDNLNGDWTFTTYENFPFISSNREDIHWKY